ncbi:MAG: SH3 domain-containing protein [Acidobacteria bacterium]|nr:SH3 domain-containing protein [Acidobacteriota bacterium]
MRNLGFLWAAAILWSPHVLAQDELPIRSGSVQVTRATVLRSQPGNASPTIGQLSEGATLRWLEGQQMGAFLRVVGGKGPQGWVHADDIRVLSQPPAGAPPVEAVTSPCANSLAACPANGCAPAGSAHALFNQVKRQQPQGASAVALGFADLASLQSQADNLVGQAGDLSAQQRALLVSLTVAGGKVAEGSLVRLTGFIAQGLAPHPNTGESVNCRRTGPENNDFHISVAENASETEFDGIVVEMVPQNRPKQWTIEKLLSARKQKRRVLIFGKLFYDNAHLVNADPAHSLSGQPKRFSLWEVHPITRFFVCTKPNNACSANNLPDWTPLEKY